MTPQNSTDNKPCLQLQVAIDTLADLNPNYIRPAENTLKNFLDSPDNINASPMKIVTDFNGKYAESNKLGKIKAQYYTEVCEAEDDDEEVDRCDTNSTDVAHTGKTTKEFYTDIYHKFTFKVNRDGQRDQCYDIEEVKRDLMGAHMRANVRAIEKKIGESMISSIGGYLNQSSPVTSITNPDTINVIDAKGNFNPGAITLMQNQFQKKDFMGDVAYFGDTNGLLNIAAMNKKFAVANTSAGIDASKVDTTMFSGVYGLNGYSGLGAGDDHIIGVPYGSLLLSQFWFNAGVYDEGANGFLSGTSSYKTRMDLWGYTWDVKVERQGCYDLFFFELRLAVIQVPTGACKDRLPLHFLAACGDLDCSAINTSLTL